MSNALPPHRKRVKHYDIDRQGRLLTFSCYGRRPLLMNEAHRRLAGESLSRALARHDWVLLAFIFMPEHVHLVAVPWKRGGSRVSDLLYAIKRPASFRIKQHMETRADPLLHELTIRERPGKTSFRFWQEGPGHDANLEDDDDIAEAIAYVHRNPLRRKLCTKAADWEWASARQYMRLPMGTDVPRVRRWSWLSGVEPFDGAFDHDDARL